MTRPTKTILICDDDQGMRDTLTAILKRDYRVLTVSSGEAALGLLKNEDVDLILQDIRLPGTQGPAPYFVNYVKDDLVAQYGAGRVFGGGLKVKTTSSRDGWGLSTRLRMNSSVEGSIQCRSSKARTSGRSADA